MIITKIRMQEEHPMSNTTKTWPLPVCDLSLDSSSGENGYILRAVVGIGPPEFIAVVDGFDSAGVPVMDSIPDKRDIALRIAFNPGVGQTISDLRTDLQRYISRSVVLSFMNNSSTLAQVKGYISRFEALHFSSLPEIQITIRCKTGDFYAPESIEIPLGTINNTLTPIISYNEGDAPTGLDLQIKYTGTTVTNNFTISKHNAFWYNGDSSVNNNFTVTYTPGFVLNDIITISTNPRSKKITLLRGTTTYDLAGYINSGAVWPKLYPGVNYFEWTFKHTGMTGAWMEWISASYTPKFWGI